MWCDKSGRWEGKAIVGSDQLKNLDLAGKKFSVNDVVVEISKAHKNAEVHIKIASGFAGIANLDASVEFDGAFKSIFLEFFLTPFPLINKHTSLLKCK